MIDLHLHLDGSLSKDDFIYLAKKDGIDLTIDFPNNIYVERDCKSLEQYLTRFDLPCSLMQSRENISYVVESLVNRLYNMGYIYAEIRFAPLLHTLKGLDEIQVINAAIAGLKKGLAGKTNFDANLILCCMRQVADEINMKTIDAAIEIGSEKVVAIDLAGPEAYKPTISYLNLFKKCRENNLNVIIHAGEACGNESILEALELGATRIGHGVHLSFDEDSLKKVKNIYFEFCPTSNLQTKSISSYKEFPLKIFMNHNLKVTINSDNMTVSNTNVVEEFKAMVETFDLSQEDVNSLLLNSIDAAFINEERKDMLRKLLSERIKEFYLKLKK